MCTRVRQLTAVFYAIMLTLTVSTHLTGADNAPVTLGVVYPGPHPLVDDVLTGLRAGLKKNRLQEDAHYIVVQKHAAGDPSNFTSACQAVIALGAEILVPIATPTTQALVKENGGRLPIVFIAVTDPVGAGLLTDLQKPGGNLTGVSDAWPYREQLQLMRTIAPKVRRIGVMYNPAEENSVYGIRQIREIAATLDLIVIDGTVAGPAELATRANSLIATNRVDALFLSSDNTVLGAAEAAIKAGHDHGTPVFSGDSGTVERGAVASASIGYVGVGEQAASLIARVVAGEKAGDIPVHIASASEIHVNLDAARAVDLTITPEIRSQATRLYGTDKPSDAGFAYLYTILGAVLGSIAILVLLVMLRRRLSNRT